MTETRLTVDVFVSSIHIEPAPKPRPHEPVPILVRETTLFVLGSILRRYGWPYSLTQTHLPPAAAAQGAAYGATWIFATTFGCGGGRDRGREQGDECARHGPNIVRDRSSCYEVGLNVG